MRKGRFAFIVTDEGETVMMVDATPFDRCDRCQQPSDELVKTDLPVLPYSSRGIVTRRLCVACCVALHGWWYNLDNATPTERKI
jgi:hypothetical protein